MTSGLVFLLSPSVDLISFSTNARYSQELSIAARNSQTGRFWFRQQAHYFSRGRHFWLNRAAQVVANVMSQVLRRTVSQVCAMMVGTSRFRKTSDKVAADESLSHDSSPEAFIPVKSLPGGSSGEISVVASSRTNRKYVVKKVKARKANGICKEPKELSIPRDHLTPHPNIIDVLSVEPSSDWSYYTLRMDYCSGGDLQDIVDHYTKTAFFVPEILVLHAFIGLTDALAYLHQGIVYGSAFSPSGKDEYVPLAKVPGVVHRDLKPRNVFLRWNPDSVNAKYNLPDIVLADFGHCGLEGQTSSHLYGTFLYFPPECRTFLTNVGSNIRFLARPLPMTSKCDIWTMGATIHELATLQPPEECHTPRTPLDSVYEFRRINDAMLRCLVEDPVKRPTARELLIDARKFRVQRDVLFERDGPVPGRLYPNPPDWVEATRDERIDSANG